MTQEQLATRLEVFSDTVGNWETGRKPVKANMKKLLALCLEAKREDIAEQISNWPAKSIRYDDEMAAKMDRILTVVEQIAETLESRKSKRPPGGQ